jgi:hypothetical protein
MNELAKKGRDPLVPMLDGDTARLVYLYASAVEVVVLV